MAKSKKYDFLQNLLTGFYEIYLFRGSPYIYKTIVRNSREFYQRNMDKFDFFPF